MTGIPMVPSTETGNDKRMWNFGERNQELLLFLYSILQIRKLRHRVSKQLDQSHNAGKQQTWKMNLGSVASESEFLTLSYIAS